MFDEIPTHVLNHSAPRLAYPRGPDSVYRCLIHNAANVCALQSFKQSLLSTGVPHE